MKPKFCENCGQLIRPCLEGAYREYADATDALDAFRAIRDYEEGRTQPLEEFIEELEAEGEL